MLIALRMAIHQIINSHGLSSGGAERLASRLHLSLSERGFQVRLIGLLKDLDALNPYSWKALLGVLKILKDSVQSEDIVHAHLSPAIIYCAIGKLLLRKHFHLVMTEHNTHNNRRGTFKGKLVDSFVYRMMDHVICISEGTKRSLNDWMPVTKSKSIVIPNGVPLNFDRIPQRSESGTLQIVSVGRLHKQKNYDTSLKALAIVNHQLNSANGLSIRYCIAGKGNLETELKSLAQELGITQYVEFLGHVSDVPALLAKSDIFLMPSRWEGFGLAAVEAMNAGLPVIASHVEGIRELVEGDDPAGLLVDPESVDSIATAIIRLVKSSGDRESFARNGFARSRQYSEERMVQGYLDLYKRLTAS